MSRPTDPRPAPAGCTLNQSRPRARSPSSRGPQERCASVLAGTERGSTVSVPHPAQQQERRVRAGRPERARGLGGGRVPSNTTAPGSMAGADRQDAAHQCDQRLTVVKVSAGDAHRERQPVVVTDDVNLRSELAAIGRIRSSQRPPSTSRILTKSIAQRAQSSSPYTPSRSRTPRCSLAHTRAVDRSVKRRCTVRQEAPKTGGNCRQVRPEFATKMIAARGARSSHRRRPPP